MGKMGKLSCISSSTDSVRVPSDHSIVELKLLKSSEISDSPGHKLSEDNPKSSKTVKPESPRYVSASEMKSMFGTPTHLASQWDESGGMDKTASLPMGQKRQVMRFYPSYLLQQQAEATFSLPRTHYPLRRKSTHRNKKKHPKKAKHDSRGKADKANLAPQPEPRDYRKASSDFSSKVLGEDGLTSLAGGPEEGGLMTGSSPNLSLGSMMRIEWWGKDSPKPDRKLSKPTKLKQDEHPDVFCEQEDCGMPGCHGGSMEMLNRPRKTSELKKFGRLAKGYSWCDVYSGKLSLQPAPHPS